MRSVNGAAARAFIALVFAVPAAAQSAPLPTYGRDIAPIQYRSCASCHRPGESGRFSLLSYEDAKRYPPQIAAAVRTRSMPPWRMRKRSNSSTRLSLLPPRIKLPRQTAISPARTCPFDEAVPVATVLRP